MTELEDTFWNGEPAAAKRVTVIVGAPLLPSWWCARLEGTRRKAVAVAQGGRVLLLDDQDGTGWQKVTWGQGLAQWPHRDLPASSVVVDP